MSEAAEAVSASWPSNSAGSPTKFASQRTIACSISFEAGEVRQRIPTWL